MDLLLLALGLAGCTGQEPVDSADSRLIDDTGDSDTAVDSDTDTGTKETGDTDTDTDTAPPASETWEQFKTENRLDLDNDKYLIAGTPQNILNQITSGQLDNGGDLTGVPQEVITHINNQQWDCDDHADTGSAVYQYLSGFRDGDGDTYTSGNLDTVCTGKTLSGYALNQKTEDCDDANPDVNPGMSEVCNDGIDNNCDGSDNGCILMGAYTLAVADAELTGEAGSDYAGNADGAGDVNGDGYDDVIVGAYKQGSDDAGAAYIKHGPFMGASSLSVADSKWTGENASDEAGVAVVGVGDVNGDGYADVAVGARYQDGNGTSSGAAYLITTDSSGTHGLAEATAKLAGEGEYNFAGTGLSSAGDQDGDGIDDFLVGAPGYNGGAFGHGAVYLLGLVTGIHTLDEVTKATIIGNADSDGAGGFISGGKDIDGDGLSDILIGANDQQSLFYGIVSGSYLMSDADTHFTGLNIGSASAFGDLDGDGLNDIVIGAGGNNDVADNSGAAYVVYSPQPAGEFDVTGADAIIRGTYEGQMAGISVAAVDLDGNGNKDLVVGASDGGSDAHHGTGTTFIFYGAPSGGSSVTDADLSLTGVDNGNLSGGIVASAGDVNQDGVEDLLVSAIGTVVDGYGNSGAAYLKLGSGF